LIRLLDDEDLAVRKAAASALRKVNDLSPPSAEEIIVAFVTSAAYDNHFGELFIALDDSKRLLPAALCGRANGPSRSPAANSATSARRVPQ
jgi:HEAT repeat protein